MGVNSLWKVLEQAGCGRAVGTEDLVNPNLHKTHPFNVNDSSTIKRQTLAIDLSIWICEALTQHHLTESHAQPIVHLVYTRTLKLLHLGIKLVAVIEGKRRILSTNEVDKFHKRRCGTNFWKACKVCHELLELMGVPVVKAKAEGEALCALLNQRGIVDGVISNDGDCLLFGAKVVYTKFNMANLNDGQIIRYDASDLKAIANASDKETHGPEVEVNAGFKFDLSREDLISFAILTGSDLSGNGLDQVGYRKAIRFIFKCKQDSPLSPRTAAIDELKSWARSAELDVNVCHPTKPAEGSCCSICCHEGNKTNHLKNGCKECGTGPGESCLKFTEGDRFRKSLRKKALAAEPRFAPAQAAASYMRPNDNQVPLMLMNESSRTLQMRIPKLEDMMRSSFIIKGSSKQSSNAFLMETLGRLLARRDLVDVNEFTKKTERLSRSSAMPIPLRINKECVRNGLKCYEVTWCVTGTITDSDGNEIDGFEFNSMEPQSMFGKYFDLIRAFHENKKEEEKQGDAMNKKREAFKASLLGKRNHSDKEDLPKTENDGKRPTKYRNPKSKINFFVKTLRQRHEERPARATPQGQGDDVGKLLLAIGSYEHHIALDVRKEQSNNAPVVYSCPGEAADDLSFNSISTISQLSEGTQQECKLQIKEVKDGIWPDKNHCAVTNNANELPRQSFPDPFKEDLLSTFNKKGSNCNDSDDVITVVSTIFDECRGVVPLKRRNQPRRCCHQGTSEGRFVQVKMSSLQAHLPCKWKSVVSHLLDEICFDRITEKSPMLHEDLCCGHDARQRFPLVLQSQQRLPRNETSMATIPKLYAFPPTPAQVFEDFSYNRLRQVLVVTPPCGASMLNRPNQYPYLTPFPDKATRPVLMGGHQVCVNMGIEITVSPLTRT